MRTTHLSGGLPENGSNPYIPGSLVGIEDERSWKPYMLSYAQARKEEYTVQLPLSNKIPPKAFGYAPGAISSPSTWLALVP